MSDAEIPIFSEENTKEPRTRPKRKKLTEIPVVIDSTVEQVHKEFLQFLNDFSSLGNGESIEYKVQAAEMVRTHRTTVYVSIDDVMAHNQDLAVAIIEEFMRFERAILDAAQSFFRTHFPGYIKLEHHEKEKNIYVSFTNVADPKNVRELRTEQLGQLISLTGTVTRTSEVRPELIRGGFLCQECSSFVNDVEQQFVYTEPNRCTNGMCENKTRWTLEMTESHFVDWQKLRLQENASEIPPGSMPRHIDVIVRNEEVEKIKPGDMCVFVGSLVVIPDVSQIYGGAETSKAGKGKPDPNYQGVVGVKSMGVRSLTYRLAFIANNASLAHKKFKEDLEQGESIDFERESVLESMTDQEKQDLLAMSESPNIYTRLAESIAPSIYGHIEIKKGILLMLMGGVHKTTFDHIKLRGDVNVCLIGDPSTAKSQFLKFVCSFLPRSIYTSGKASSAAGLTASVVKDPETREFGIEAGALMLADNGVCCIDEFEKMDPKDQAAIHEAMEQQTISITKAGITATLNARASILAAANPIYGRYDLGRTLKENVDISAALMSRFDLFFVVTDICDENVDYNMARHIIAIHQDSETKRKPPFELKLMQNYVRYARTIKPQMNEDAVKKAIKSYTELRKSDSGGSKSAYRITVRQLESLIRLSEGLARVELKDIVTEKHVEEASRLLKKSIIPIQNDAVDLEGEEDALSKSISDSGKSISFEEYNRISNLFIRHIKRKEKISEVWNGITETELLEWYLEQGNDTGLFVGEESAGEYLEVAKAVMNRLIKVDNVIIVVDEPELVTEENRGSRVVDVHPNFDPDRTEIDSSQTQTQSQSQTQSQIQSQAQSQTPSQTQSQTQKNEESQKNSQEKGED